MLDLSSENTLRINGFQWGWLTISIARMWTHTCNKSYIFLTIYMIEEHCKSNNFSGFDNWLGLNVAPAYSTPLRKQILHSSSSNAPSELLKCVGAFTHVPQANAWLTLLTHCVHSFLSQQTINLPLPPYRKSKNSKTKQIIPKVNLSIFELVKLCIFKRTQTRCLFDIQGVLLLFW